MKRYFSFNETLTRIWKCTLWVHISLLNNQTICKGISGDGIGKEKKGAQFVVFFQKKKRWKKTNLITTYNKKKREKARKTALFLKPDKNWATFLCASLFLEIHNQALLAIRFHIQNFQNYNSEKSWSRFRRLRVTSQIEPSGCFTNVLRLQWTRFIQLFHKVKTWIERKSVLL